MTNVNNDHIGSLLQRCCEIKKLDLKHTGITNEIVEKIVFHLGATLEELNVSHTEINQLHLSHLAQMPKLRILNCYSNSKFEIEEEVVILKNQFPKLIINENSIHIASPYETFEPEDGIWDMKVKSQQDQFDDPVYRKFPYKRRICNK